MRKRLNKTKGKVEMVIYLLRVLILLLRVVFCG